MSGRGSRLAAVRPSLLGVASSWSVVSTAAVAAAVMAVIPVVTAEVESEVTLVVPPPMAAEEERRETGLPVSPDSRWQRVPKTRVPDGFYPIRRQVWKIFCTRGYVIG